MRRSVRKLVGLAGFLLLWELACLTGVLDPDFVPSPLGVVTRLGGMFGDPVFRADFIATVLSWLIAILISTGIAVPLGLLMGNVPVLRTATSVVVEFLRPVPAITLIPVAMITLGDGAQTKIALAAFGSLWPILFNVIYGLQEVDPQFVDTARSYHSGYWRVAFRVRLPAAAPFALTGVRLAAAISLVIVVSTEFLSSSGIGFGEYIFAAGEQIGDMRVVVSGAVLAGLLGWLVNWGLVAAQSRWLPWSAKGGAV